MGGAIQSALRMDAPLLAALGPDRVHDEPPANAIYPFVSIDQLEERNDANGAAKAWVVFVSIRVWSRAASSLEARELAGLVVDVLDGLALPAGSYEINWRDYQRTRTLRDPSGKTRFALVEFEFGLTRA